MMAAQGMNTRPRNSANDLVRDTSTVSNQSSWLTSEPISSDGRNVNKNVSLQTGEEFSMEFLKDHTRTEAPIVSGMTHSDGQRFGELYSQNHQLGFDNVSRFLGLRRMESECASNAYDFGHDTRMSKQFENDAYSGKFHGYHNVGVESEVGTRKAFGELNSNQGGVVGPSAPSVYLPEHAQSNNYSGAGVPHRSGKVKFLCSFGGKILPRSTDGKLKYVGGETHIISIHKNLSWEELKRKTSAICPQAHSVKYQLPGDDLDSLISVTSDEDLQNMIEEYNGLQRPEGSQRPRLFLIPISLYDENNVQQSTPDYHYVAALNGNIDPNTMKSSGGQALAGETSYRVTCLDHTPSFHKRSRPQLLQVETRGGVHAMHPTQIFNGLHYNMSPYPSPPVSPMPLQRGGSKGTYSQLYGNNSSSESNSSYSTAQPDISNIEMIDSRYHQRQPLSSVNCPPYKQNDTNQKEQPYVIQLHHDGFNENFLSPVSGRIDRVGFAPEKPACNKRTFSPKVNISQLEESKVLPSGSANSNGFQFGLSHSQSDSTLELSGGHFAYCSQERLSPSSQLNLKTQMQEKLVQLHSNTDLADRRTQSNILDFRSTEGAEAMFKCMPSHIENDTIHMDTFSEGNHHNEIYQNQDTTRKGAYCETMTRATPSEMECKYLPLGGNRTLLFAADSWRQIKEDNAHMITGNSATDVIPLTEDIIDHSSNHEPPRVPSFFNMENERRVTAKPSDLVQGPGTDAACARETEVSRLLPNMGIGSIESILVNLTSSKSPKTLIVDDQVHLELGLAPKHVDTDSSTVISPENVHSFERQDRPLVSFNNNNPREPQSAPRESSSRDEDLGLDQDENSNSWRHHFSQTFGEETFSHDRTQIKHMNQPNPDIANLTDDLKNLSVEMPYSPGTVRHTEAGSGIIICDSGNVAEKKSEEVENIPGDEDNDLNDTNIAEIEASVYGLQIIKNADLEDLTELGSGTYGTVYHGKWRGTDVAIKRIRKSCFAGRSSEQERLTKDFWREAQILSNLHHPNVVAFYGVVPDGVGGTLATVTEFMVNGSLRHALLRRDKLLDSRKKIIIAMDAAFGMEYLHSKNIVHFDLKCDNLLVNLRDPQRPICKVGDLGLSRIKRNTLISGGVRGTLPWMAPELLNGSSNRVSEKVDVYSFGISMWEILTGEEPYADMHCGAIIGGIVKNTLRPHIPENCPPDWRKLMEQCWSEHPDSRPSFTEITSRLRSMSMDLHSKGNSKKRK